MKKKFVFPKLDELETLQITRTQYITYILIYYVLETYSAICICRASFPYLGPQKNLFFTTLPSVIGYKLY